MKLGILVHFGLIRTFCLGILIFFRFFLILGIKVRIFAKIWILFKNYPNVTLIDKDVATWSTPDHEIGPTGSFQGDTKSICGIFFL